MIIYALTDAATGEIRYIGKTKDLRARLQDHLDTAKKMASHKQKWVASVGGCIGVQVLKEVPDERASIWEKCFIQAFREEGFRLTNATEGGDGLSNPSPATRLKMSLSHKGKPTGRKGMRQRPETVELVRAAAKAQWARMSLQERAEQSAKMHKTSLDNLRRNLGWVWTDAGWLKPCKGCGLTKPATREFWYYRNGCIAHRCKPCLVRKNNEYRSIKNV